MDNMVPRLLESHFPERIPQTEKKSRPTKGVLCVTRTIRGRRQCFGVLIVMPLCVMRPASGLTAQSSSIKVKSILLIKNFGV
jgi:hypothetical protein